MSADRDRLAAALVSFGIDYAQEASDALLPVVQALVAEGAAAELRAAADEWERHGWQVVTVEAVRARADDLTAGSEANR